MNNNKQDIPATIKIENFKNGLKQLIEGCDLHPFIIMSVLKDFLTEITMYYNNLATQENNDYQKQLKEKGDIDA